MSRKWEEAEVNAGAGVCLRFFAGYRTVKIFLYYLFRVNDTLL